MKTTNCLVVACAGLAFACPGQQRDWLSVKTAIVPPPSEGHAMVYDSARDRVVLFGGLDPASHNPPNPKVFYGETWEWGGGDWVLVQKSVAGVTPPKRAYHSMAYDSVRKRTVLFGGWGNPDRSTRTGYFGDTWEWDGIKWTRIDPVGAPIPRGWFAMVFDSARQKTVLFGGYNPLDNTKHHSDTWEWDGVRWTLRTPQYKPTGRWGHAMAYDSDRNVTVMFGGNDGKSYLDETWEWDGTQWREKLFTWPPAARGWHSMAYDFHARRVVLYGGTDGQTCLKTTFDYVQKDNEQQWVVADPATVPAGRFGHAAVYDSERRCTLVFSGWGPSDPETWVLGSIATFQGFGAGCGSPPVVLSAAEGSRPVIGQSFRLVTRNLPGGTTTAMMTVGLSNTSFGGGTLPMPLDSIGFDGCYLYTSLDAAWFFPVYFGEGEFAAKIPFDFQLVGNRLYFQSAAGKFTSNGGEVVFGNM